MEKEKEREIFFARIHRLTEACKRFRNKEFGETQMQSILVKEILDAQLEQAEIVKKMIKK